MKYSIPSMPFYPFEFISETMFLTNEQIGKYIKMLCAFYMHGRLAWERLASVCGGADSELLSLLDVDENGFYYKKKLEAESERREAFLKSKIEKKAASARKRSAKTEKSDSKRSYGIYDNVMLTDEEYEELCDRFGTGTDARIKALSEYMKISGKTYKSHYAVIISWDEKNKAKASEDQSLSMSTFDTDDFFEAAVAQSKEYWSKSKASASQSTSSASSS